MFAGIASCLMCVLHLLVCHGVCCCLAARSISKKASQLCFHLGRTCQSWHSEGWDYWTKMFVHLVGTILTVLAFWRCLRMLPVLTLWFVVVHLSCQSEDLFVHCSCPSWHSEDVFLFIILASLDILKLCVYCSCQSWHSEDCCAFGRDYWMI